MICLIMWFLSFFVPSRVHHTHFQYTSVNIALFLESFPPLLSILDMIVVFGYLVFLFVITYNPMPYLTLHDMKFAPLMYVSIPYGGVQYNHDPRFSNSTTENMLKIPK